MTLKLYSRYRNSAGQRVRITLNLKGIDYEYVAVDDMRTEAYRKINPQGLLPALDIDGTIVGQSTAIIDWLEETYPTPSILPHDPMERMTARSIAQFIACEIHPIHNHRVRDHLVEVEGWSEEKTMEWYAHWIDKGLTTVETMLAQRKKQTTFCVGDAPTIADIYLVPVLGNARWFGFPLDAYPRVLAADAACAELDAFRLAMPEAQPDFPGYEAERT